MTRTLQVACLCIAWAGCSPAEDSSAISTDGTWALSPPSGGRGTAVPITLEAASSIFRFGETEVSLGEGIEVLDLTVQDGWTATGHVLIAEDAALGRRDVVVTIQGSPRDELGHFQVVPESIRIEPADGKMGELVEVKVSGVATDWTDGYTWASFGPGVDVLDVQVHSITQATATISIHPDAPPGLRDVRMESGSDVVALYDGFTVDRAAITATFDPPEAWQGDLVDFTIEGVDTRFGEDAQVQFWDQRGWNPDIAIVDLNRLDAHTIFGRMRLSNAAKPGLRDVRIASSDETILVPDALEVLDAPPDLSRVAIRIGLDVIRGWDETTGQVGEQVSAYAYFYIPLDPPCGAGSSPIPGPVPYDVNGVFEIPPSTPQPDCPTPERVSAGDHVWFESDENIITLVGQVSGATGLLTYRPTQIGLSDYHFGQWYDLVTEGDPNGIPAVRLEDVQPTVPADFALLSPDFPSGLTVRRDEPFTYTWTPAQTYPEAIFSTQISGTLSANGASGFVGALPWDDGLHTYNPAQLSQLQPGTVTFSAASGIVGPYFGFPFSTIQNNRSSSSVSIGGRMVLE